MDDLPLPRNMTHWYGQLLHPQKEPPCPELAQEHIPATAGAMLSSNTPLASGSAGTPSIHHSHSMSWSPRRALEQLLPSLAAAEALSAHRWSGERPMPMMCPWMSMT